MRYHVVINAFYEGYEKQAIEINGFIKSSKISFQQGNTIIVCDGKQDGDGKQKLAEMAPTKSVIFVYVNEYNPELILKYLEDSIDMDDLYIFGSTYSGEELAVRLGKRMDGSSLIGCMRLTWGADGMEAEKMVYSSHMKGRFLLGRAPYCVSISKGQPEGERQSGENYIASETSLSDQSENRREVTEKFEEAESGDGLEDAAFAVVAGRGIRKKEAALEVQELAGKIGAAFGASRPVVMNAWASMETLIGVSGAMLKPKICMVLGASGAPAFYAAIEKSQFIVAVNTDERAAITKKADLVIVDDGVEVLRELVRQIGEEA